jgi:hypothetical protein
MLEKTTAVPINFAIRANNPSTRPAIIEKIPSFEVMIFP